MSSVFFTARDMSPFQSEVSWNPMTHAHNTRRKLNVKTQRDAALGSNWNLWTLPTANVKVDNKQGVFRIANLE